MKTNKQLFLYFFCLPCGWGGWGGGLQMSTEAPLREGRRSWLPQTNFCAVHGAEKALPGAVLPASISHCQSRVIHTRVAISTGWETRGGHWAPNHGRTCTCAWAQTNIFGTFCSSSCSSQTCIGLLFFFFFALAVRARGGPSVPLHGV